MAEAGDLSDLQYLDWFRYICIIVHTRHTSKHEKCDLCKYEIEQTIRKVES